MSTQNKPVTQLEFHGVYTAGNPANRPRNTAAKCTNFRIMPGFWPRLRGGQKARNYSAGTVQQIFPIRGQFSQGSSSHLAQIKNTGPACNWNWFGLPSFVIDPFGVETISLSFDNSFSASNPAAATNLSDRALFYNGLGVRDGTNSRPAFTSYDGSIPRYYGLDAYCPSGNPTVAFAAGAGNNQVITKINIYVGLYHQSTEHYSNGVFAGSITTTGASGTITVSNLGRLKTAYHNGTEQGELFYVFYATVDGGAVPYQIFNSALDGPLKTATTNSSMSLSVASATTNGWNLNLTAEAPIDNLPPRPMRSVAFVNSRNYGSLLSGGSGSAISQTGFDGTRHLDFSYVPQSRDISGVVWSKASGDTSLQNFIGDPLQCWPLTNIAYTPSADQPVHVGPSQDALRVLVITPTSTYLLEEIADGFHEYITCSRVHGIGIATTVAVTESGIVWVNQRKEIVMLPKGEQRVIVLSDAYQNLLNGNARCADYVLDPVNEIDRYEVFLDDGTSVIHDFRIGGEGYCSLGRDYTAARTCVNTDGTRNHILAKNGIYTQEAQPDTGLIPTTDELYTSPSATAVSEINGEYQRNWDCFADSSLVKEFFFLDVIGDGASSAQLSNVSPLVLEWYYDFKQLITGNKQTTGQPVAPAQGSPAWRFKLSKFNHFWYKLVFKLSGHSTDDASFTSHANPAVQGDLAKNFYGSILTSEFEIGRTNTENRP